ncbi:MAG: zf-HC2 domain-containing protein [Clostridia bacterium]|nr:zf-HC2 domain-containing protein [Clostridia bacterium]
MECNIIKDLIPLYIDNCCSEESAEIVKKHIDYCPKCKGMYENMRTPSDIVHTVSAPTKLNRINDWRASVLQSVLLFISFAIITAGVALEAASPTGFTNGYWAVSLVIPATGFLLSLANWYFIRIYKSKKNFSDCSFFTTLVITLLSYIWAGFHYEWDVFDFTKINFTDSLEIIVLSVRFFWIGLLLTIIFCTLSKILSNKYAKMLGKE